jgi:predicted nuclease of predicted toxin-antitoxin system
VKFLLNMNIPPALGPMLAAQGHPCRHARDVGLARASDSAILAEARANAECVITHDLDYGQLLAFSGDSAPSVITFRLRRVDTPLMFKRLIAEWRDIEQAVVAGAVVTIEEAARRSRLLPIAKAN